MEEVKVMPKKAGKNDGFNRRRVGVLSVLFMLAFIMGISPTVTTGTDDTWVSRADMLTPRYGSGAALVNGRIYVIGGVDTDNNALATVEVYNPAKDRWSSRTNMLTPRGFFATVVVNGRIYVIGGYIGMWNVIPTVEEYIPAEDRWNKLADMPTPLGDCGGAAVGGKIYAIGGAGGLPPPEHQPLPTVEEYDPRNNQWLPRYDMPTARWGVEAVA